MKEENVEIKNINKTFVIADIHGAYKALKQCLERSNFDKENDTLIFLGDVCDGWNEVYESIEELLTIKNLVPILGNHDEVFIQWIKSGNHGWDWLQGAKATAESYAKHVYDREVQILPEREGYKINLTYADIPQSHLDFFNSMLVKYIDDKNRCFVHGGFNRHYPLSGQSKDVIIWDRDLFMSAFSNGRRKDKDKFKFKIKDNFDEIYIGHTTTMNWNTDKPILAPPVINMDTGAGFRGRLTIMDIDSKACWQSDLVQELYPEQKGRN